jgi:hypothetical protein
VSTRQLVVPWGQRHELVRDEKLTAALDAHAAEVADSALGEAASAVLESTGEPGASAAAIGTMMSESELQRIIDRAGLTSAPADLHPLAYRDRHGYVHVPLDATVELARAFAAAERTTVTGYLDDQAEEMQLRGNEPVNAGGTATSVRKRPALQSRGSGRASNRRRRFFARRSRACGRSFHAPPTNSSTLAPRARLIVCFAPSKAGR